MYLALRRCETVFIFNLIKRKCKYKMCILELFELVIGHYYNKQNSFQSIKKLFLISKQNLYKCVSIVLMFLYIHCLSFSYIFDPLYTTKRKYMFFLISNKKLRKCNKVTMIQIIKLKFEEE